MNVVYTNGKFEVIKSRTCEGIRYEVKRVGVKGIWFIYNDLNCAIDTADKYKDFNL